MVSPGHCKVVQAVYLCRYLSLKASTDQRIYIVLLFQQMVVNNWFLAMVSLICFLGNFTLELPPPTPLLLPSYPSYRFSSYTPSFPFSSSLLLLFLSVHAGVLCQSVITAIPGQVLLHVLPLYNLGMIIVSHTPCRVCVRVCICIKLCIGRTHTHTHMHA